MPLHKDASECQRLIRNELVGIYNKIVRGRNRLIAKGRMNSYEAAVILKEQSDHTLDDLKALLDKLE